MDKSKFHKTPLSLGVKMGTTLSYAVFCNYCGFEIQECPDIKSIELLKNVIQEIVEVNPIKKYTQANWKNWIKTSQLIIPNFNDVWEELKKIRQNYFRKTIQEMWRKMNDFDYSQYEYDIYEKRWDEKAWDEFQKSWEKDCRERQRKLARELAHTNDLWEVLVKTKQKITYSHSLTDNLSDLDPWTRNLVGVVDLGSEDSKESYIDYLVEKYR
jgi:hypothetical protein